MEPIISDTHINHLQFAFRESLVKHPFLHRFGMNQHNIRSVNQPSLGEIIFNHVLDIGDEGQAVHFSRCRRSYGGTNGVRMY